MTPVATVGIPFFDEERHLAQAVRSVLGQTTSEIEVLLVDDGSRDRSLAIARSFDDPRVRVVSDGVRRGLPARLNEIARLARADVVARMDADDVAHPRRLDKQLGVLRREGCDAVGAWVSLVDEHDEILAVMAPPSRRSRSEVLDMGVFPHATMVARRSWLLANPYDESLTRAEDRELFSRTASTAHFTVIPEVLYVVRVSARGRAFLSDYRASQAQNRTIFRRHGPGVVGSTGTLRRIAASFAKSAAMTAAVHLGVADRLVKRRGRPPCGDERAMTIDALVASRG